MPVPATVIFADLRALLKTSGTPTARYSQLYAILSRLCSAYAETLNTDFSGLFSRLYAICQAVGIDHHTIDAVRRRARLFMNEQPDSPFEQACFDADTRTVATFAARLWNTDLPDDLQDPHRRRIATKGTAKRSGHMVKVRAIVTAVDRQGATVAFTTGSRELTATCPHLQRTIDVLEPGMPVNLIDVRDTKPQETQVGMIIIDPDYLIDVSALTATFKPYGAQATNYLLDLLTPRQNTPAIMLGNAANDFMDELVNNPAPADSPVTRAELYGKALRKHFCNHLLTYACLEEPLGPDYFEALRTAFDHIADAVTGQFGTAEVGLPLDSVLLEPAFICETLGLRGRFDVMAVDHHSLVELKSGKAEEFGGQVRPRHPHVLQMSLYKEMLHYNFGLPRDTIKSFLFYSRYPAFYHERSSADAVNEALELRNEIVAMEQALRHGACSSILARLEPDQLNRKGTRGRFWQNYLRPSIERVSQPLEAASPLEKKYLYHFLTFIEREKYLGKTSDNRPDSNRGLASAWTTDLKTKQAAGDILINLQITSASGEGGIDCLTFALPDYGPDFIPNFNQGEMVQLYERRDERDNVTTRQLVRGYIESLTSECLQLRLNYKQRNVRLFPAETRYAIEHDGSDAPATTAVRGLFSLLTATPRRRALLLGQRLPEVGQPLPLLGNYPAATAAIVSAASRAQDYFLLIGPPGTGKTSVALKAMVQEFLLRQKSHADGAGLLLMAYTNRAVDEICGMLETIPAPYVRLGNEQVCHKDFRPRLIGELLKDCHNRREVREAMAALPIVVGTVSTLASHAEIFRLRPFEAIIDESSQVLEPQILGLLCGKTDDGHSAIRRFVMIGDHKQLPAVVLLPDSQTRVTDKDLREIGLTDLRNSLFQRLHQLLETKNCTTCMALLDRQGRMHEDICQFVNSEFYDQRLQAVPLPHQTSPLNLRHTTTSLEQFIATTRMGFIDIRPNTLPSNNKANTDEANCVARLIAEINTLYARNHRQLDMDRQIGVIVPFRNQIGRVRQALRELDIDGTRLTVDTVECYQGSQRDIIIFSTTISQPYQLDILSNEQQVGNTTVDRKLNVALTRARLQFFMIGNGAILKQRTIYARLISNCKIYNC